MNINEKINKNTIIRLLSYKNCLKRFKTMGLSKVFSDNLADSLSIKSSQVRKDFSLLNIMGNKRGGYLVDDLLKEIIMILGKNRTYEVILVGMGNIGQAIIRYKGFEKDGIKIIAGFDINPGRFQNNQIVSVYHMDTMATFIAEHKIDFAIIAVPDTAAQPIFDQLVAAGIKGVLNFAPIELRNPGDRVVTHNINLVQELENIIYFVNARKEE